MLEARVKVLLTADGYHSIPSPLKKKKNATKTLKKNRGYLPAQHKKKALRPFRKHRNVQLPPSCTESVVHLLVGISFNTELCAQSCLTLLDELFQLAAHVANRFVRNTILFRLSLSVTLSLRAHEISAGTQTATVPCARLWA
jgi:hypothetical protein